MKVEILNTNRSVFIKLVLVALSITLLVGCGGNAKQESADSSETDSQSTVQNEETPSAKTADNGLIKLVVNSNDQMKFDTEELRVKAGAKVELTLNHTGQLPKETMGHNFVILKSGTDIASFAQKAISAIDNGYIPEGDETITYTALIGGGESTTITFDAPAEGTYDFICSFPGHYALMKGKFIVE